MPPQPSLSLEYAGGGMTVDRITARGTTRPGARVHLYATADCSGPENPQDLWADETGAFSSQFYIGTRRDKQGSAAQRSVRVEDEQGRLSACTVAFYTGDVPPPLTTVVKLTNVRDGTLTDWSMPFASDGGRLFFVAPLTGDAGFGLWRSDGTPEGTFVVASFDTEPEVTATTTAAGRFYFVLSGSVLWTSDGTAEGTTPLLTLAAPQSLGWMGTAGGRPVFLVRDDGQDVALWTSDGSEAGTQPLTALADAADRTPTTPLTEDSVLFAAAGGVSGLEPWRTDGTAEGTARVADLAPGGVGSGPQGMHRMGSRVFFSADDGATGRELWVTDGTASGTRQVMDLTPGAEGSRPTELVDVDGFLFFSAAGRLWKSNGTPEGTRALPGIVSPVELTPMGGSLFFRSVDPNSYLGRDYLLGYMTDVSALPQTIGLPSFQYIPQWRTRFALTPADTTLLFYAFDSLEGYGWWQFDGKHVPSRRPGQWLRMPKVGSSQPLWAARVGARIVFTGQAQLYSIQVADIPDSTPPELTCPGEVTVTVGEQCTPVSYPAVPAQEAVSTPQVTYVPAPGSPLPFGVTKVTVIAYDRAGNGSTCSFPLRVQ
jgi:ELWxxDGT repeat protein